MKELTLEQFERDCELLRATHTEEEVERMAESCDEADLGSETYQEWCAFADGGYYQAHWFPAAQKAYAREQKLTTVGGSGERVDP
jgi:Xaa-Pro aminopeptidase